MGIWEAMKKKQDSVYKYEDWALVFNWCPLLGGGGTGWGDHHTQPRAVPIKKEYFHSLPKCPAVNLLGSGAIWLLHKSFQTTVDGRKYDVHGSHNKTSN